MLNLPKFEPTPQLTKSLRVAAEAWVAAAPWDANQLSNLAYLLVSDYLNRWNEAENDPDAGKPLLSKAESKVAEALAIDSNLAAARYANGFVLRAQGNFSDAKKEFADLTIRYPNWAAAYAHEGNEWINLGPENTKVALRLVQQALSMDSSKGVFYWIQGRAYFFMKDYENAIVSLKKSIDMRDNIWYNRLYLVSAYTKRIPQDATTIDVTRNELANFRQTFPLFTRDTLDQYENDILNPNLSFDEFHAGLDDAGFKHGTT
jgi:tetratricopeptide (TPR) repeat protein